MRSRSSRSEATFRGIELDVNVAPDVPPVVLGDATRLRQIILNLLSNAIKFTDNGRVRVRLYVDTTATAALRFEVSDWGPGIPLERQHLLFTDFTQLESLSTTTGGTGLGLAISKRLVELMGGTIGVISDVGCGSTFWFSVRLPPGQPAQINSAAVPVVDARHILVADDNAINQVIVESMLRQDGHTVELVNDGAAAVEAVASRHFDLVLMDMQMPVMNGIEATCHIRALRPEVRDIPIIALTANAMADQVARCRVAGMNDHLAKPIERDLLRRAIVKWSRPADAPVTVLRIDELLDVFDDDGAPPSRDCSTQR